MGISTSSIHRGCIPLLSRDSGGVRMRVQRYVRGRQEVPMTLSATLKKDSEDGGVVRYVDSYGGTHAFLSNGITIKASDLPDPPPALLRVSLDWYQAPRAQTAPPKHIEGALRAAGVEKIAPGDVVMVIKSRMSGVQNPPEWLQQHLGKTGTVAWVTLGGANVDLGDETVWFGYDELEKVV
jgi:hypothetical protein